MRRLERFWVHLGGATLVFDHRQDRADVRVGPVDHEQVREPRCRDAEIRERAIVPGISNSLTIATDDIDRGQVLGGGKTSRHDNGINFPYLIDLQARRSRISTSRSTKTAQDPSPLPRGIDIVFKDLDSFHRRQIRSGNCRPSFDDPIIP